MTAVASRTDLPDLLGLAAVGLDELNALAALQTRVDRKYVLPLDALGPLVAALPTGTRRLVIDGADRFGYESVYFDTPGLDAFHLAAGRRRRRFKVRTRTYCDTGGSWLEVKTRGPRGTTVKTRREHDPAGRTEIGEGLPFVRQALHEQGVHLPQDVSLTPTLTTRYDRRTLFLPDGARLTIDTGLEWHGATSAVGVPEHAVVETKSTAGACAADRALWALGHRPTRISKYATGLIVLDPTLSARPWRRTLRRTIAP
ncbi:MAG TPA: polyphosphate polymerase domain-containing protein [Cellulomonas sp.]